MNRKQFDLTQGNILNRLLLVAVPIMGTQLTQMAYNLTDMFWLGRLGSDAVAAAGTGGMYLWLSNAFLMFGRMGAEIGVAQSLGKNDERAARLYAQNSLMIAAALGLCYGIIAVGLRHPLIGFFSIREPHVAADAADYLLYAGIGFPTSYIAGAAGGIFNGSGNSRIPFFVNGAGLILNIIFDPVLIINLGLGIRGAAIATAGAQTVVCLLFLIFVRMKKTAPLSGLVFLSRPDPAVIGQIARWSAPIVVENMLFTFMSMIISRLIAAWGAAAIAVQKIGAQIESVSWMIGLGFSSALTAFTGQNYGAGKWTRIHAGFRIALITILSWGVFVTVLLIAGGRFFFSLFLSEPRALAMGAAYTAIIAYAQMPAMLEYVSAGVFRGIGLTLPPSIVSISCNVFRVILAYLLSRTSLGLDGIWWGLAIGMILRGIGLFLWYLTASRQMPVDDVPLPQPNLTEEVVR